MAKVWAATSVAKAGNASERKQYRPNQHSPNRLELSTVNPMNPVNFEAPLAHKSTTGSTALVHTLCICVGQCKMFFTSIAPLHPSNEPPYTFL
eukprot:1159365-Pelagomonas_calceolata.AAC.1